jgi:serine/threonine protein kinase
VSEPAEPGATDSRSGDGPKTVDYDPTPSGGGPRTLDYTPTPDPVGEGTGYVRLGEIAAGPRYTRSSLHASGGMGHVWLARDDALGRDVAIKELRAEGATDRASARFVREARLTGQLEHPGVVPVYELGRDPQTGRPFYAMRFVRGRTLTEVAAAFHAARRPGWHEPMDLVRLLAAFVSICNTVSYAHSHGIVHRDLKGENVILGEFGEVIVLDWGLAKRLDGSEEDAGADDPAPVADPAAGRTVMGQVVGTPGYMAPEQAQGRPDLVGPHTDVFGLGAILYEILTGGPPFAGATIQEVLVKTLHGEPAPPRAAWPEAPPGLEAACLRALARSPADRHPTAAALGQEVQGWQDRQRRLAEDELRQAFDRMNRQQAALVALTRTEVFAGPDLTAIFRQLVEAAARTLGVERVSIWRFTADGRAIRCEDLYELGPDRHSAGVELRADAYPDYFAALAATEVIAADDAQHDPRTREFTAGYLVPLGIGAMMEVPIHPGGVLCHEHVGPPRRWLPDEQLFAIAVGHLAAQAISHWERRRALEQLERARDGRPAD